MRKKYKRAKKWVRSSYKKGKKAYVKSLPARKAFIKRARTTRSNIDDYFAQSQREMRKIAGNYKF